MRKILASILLLLALNVSAQVETMQGVLKEMPDSMLMYLTKMDFNSSDVLYSKLPVTIKYSRVVCDIIKQGNFDDELISFEYVM